MDTFPTSVNADALAWQPDEERITRAHLTAFMGEHGVNEFDELLARSTEDIAWFTDSVLRYLDIQFQRPYSRVVDLSRGKAWPEWCVDGVMNIVDNCLDKYLGAPAEDRAALIWEGEAGDTLTLSYRDLAERVSQAANALRSLGIRRGDAVGLYMPLTAEEVIALLAIAKVGGVILPLFSGYGAGALASRLQDASARAVFVTDGFTRRGQVVEMKPVLDRALESVPSVEHVIVHRYAGPPVSMVSGRDHWWDALIDDQPSVARTESTAAEDTLMIIYTSGTTGRPKGAVHTHCGFPVKAAQDMAFGMDIHEGEVMYWMTDMGWMMGPWLVFGTLLLGATMFLYDGAPDFPDPGRVWDMVERHRIHALGLSPTFVRAVMSHGEEPIRGADLSSLHSFGSTGEPWNPAPWLWLFETVGGGQRPIINYSGGTEISGGILMGNPVLPLKPAAFSAPCPGIAADVVDEQGRSIRGEVGELVIREPWIGMTRGFWQDPDRYEATYWDRFPGLWVHGDWAMVDQDGMWYILGRSDDTIKIAGKRLGPAEVESALVAHPAVVEAAAIGIPDKVKGSSLVCFCVLDRPEAGDEQLAAELRQRLIDELGKPLAPKEILFVPDLPKTRNAKVMRRMLRAAFLGEDPGDTSALVNPEALEGLGS